MTPNEDLILLLTYLVKWLREAMGKRTRIQIECPDIIKIPPGVIVQATEDEELGTDQRHGVEGTAAGLGTIDHNAGPLSRYWNGRSHDQLERVLTSKDLTCRG